MKLTMEFVRFSRLTPQFASQVQGVQAQKPTKSNIFGKFSGQLSLRSLEDLSSRTFPVNLL